MNHTKNYNLPQWELNDLIRMEDFNGAMSNIETGIDTARTEAADAQAEAASAKVVANTAKNTADAALAQKAYVTGTYTGTGAEKSINLGFRPSFVIISGMHSVLGASNVSNYVQHFAMTGGNILTDRVRFTNTGFIVYPAAESSDSFYQRYPDLAASRTYDYIAFK